jgi:hypothetical protein
MSKVLILWIIILFASGYSRYVNPLLQSNRCIMKEKRQSAAHLSGDAAAGDLYPGAHHMVVMMSQNKIDVISCPAKFIFTQH